ncbi:MAG: hypothetical protein D8M59_13940 [Planctomycetes bacterium]|nr:hypothetical protein [Planctomycetota bacterium]NOG55610.1 hypothetical protein [Planctomycetota bacterium]
MSTANGPWIIGLIANLSYLVVLASLATLGFALLCIIIARIRRALVGTQKIGIWKGRPNRVGTVLWCLVLLAAGAWAALPVAPMIKNSVVTPFGQSLGRNHPPTSSSSSASAGNPSATGRRESVRLLLCNLGDRYEALTPLWEAAQRERADVILLAEVNPPVASAFVSRPEVEDEYPFAEVVRREMSWHMAVLSRWPLRPIQFNQTDFEHFKHLFAYRRSLYVDLPSGSRFLLAGIHAPSPRSAETWAMGNETVSLLIQCTLQYLLPTGFPVIVAGDFNSTPSGYRYRAMKQESDLHSADDVARLSGTWPAGLPIGPLRLMLDHVWGSNDVRFESCRVLEDIGSDHRPILVGFTIPANPH